VLPLLLNGSDDHAGGLSRTGLTDLSAHARITSDVPVPVQMANKGGERVPVARHTEKSIAALMPPRRRPRKARPPAWQGSAHRGSYHQALLQRSRDSRGDWTGWLGRRDSNHCILESEFAKTLSPGGGTRTCASRIEGARSAPRSCSGGMKFSRPLHIRIGICQDSQPGGRDSNLRISN